MSLTAGLKAKNGYLFVTGNTDNYSPKNGDIVQLNKNCGALIVAKQDEQLNRVKNLLDRYSSQNPENTEGLTKGFIDTLISFFNAEFKNNPSYRSMPLPFLLLGIVGIGENTGQQKQLEYVFIRNRVSAILDNKGKKEFVTEFDTDPPVSARNIFYGESNIIEYLAQQVQCDELPIDNVKVLACLPMSKVQHNIDSLSRFIKMASLSPETGFGWVSPEEILLLIDKAARVEGLLKDGFNSFMFRGSPEPGQKE